MIARLRRMLAGLALLGPVLLGGFAAEAAAAGLKRLYVLDCGRQIGQDQSRWTPGINAGQPVELSNNCYLIQHEKGMLLWETGVPDAVAERPQGVVAANGAITMFRDKTLIGQLESLGVKPEQIAYVAVSHSHGDHTGNLKRFAKSKVLMQKREYELAQTLVPDPFAEGQNVLPLEGDVDVFGDGSVMIVSTPGHTPGHQSLLVLLPETGAVILSGDLVHLQISWERRIVPSFNYNAEQSLASIARIQQLMDRHKAKLWIGHDKDMTATIQRAPKYYE